MPPRDAAIIVGASTRSAAASAVRAGLFPICLDLFGDRDLRACADVSVLRDLGEALPRLEELTRRLGRKTPVIYTGGMENRPELIAEIESRWTLWGCGSQSLRGVRDPFQLAKVLSAAGCETLRVQSNPPADEVDWLIKPVNSGGGIGIRNSDNSDAKLDANHYCQEFRSGQPMSALFIANPREQPGCELVGTCRQLIGEDFLHAPPFGWCGSIGHVKVEEVTRKRLLRVGRTIQEAFQLAGLYGVDFILDTDGIPWVTEVNPRYTGSVEVLEWALGQSLIARHVGAFDSMALSLSSTSLPDIVGRRVIGKAVLFAPRDMIANTESWPLSLPDAVPPLIADIPVQGQPISGGSPVCSVLVYGETETECLTKLRRFSLETYHSMSIWPGFAPFSAS